MDCKYSNFSQGRFERKDYLNALSKCVEVAKKPVLVHVNAFLDLPSEQELEEFCDEEELTDADEPKIQEPDEDEIIDLGLAEQDDDDCLF